LIYVWSFSSVKKIRPLFAVDSGINMRKRTDEKSKSCRRCNQCWIHWFWKYKRLEDAIVDEVILTTLSYFLEFGW